MSHRYAVATDIKKKRKSWKPAVAGFYVPPLRFRAYSRGLVHHTKRRLFLCSLVRVPSLFVVLDVTLSQPHVFTLYSASMTPEARTPCPR